MSKVFSAIFGGTIFCGFAEITWKRKKFEEKNENFKKKIFDVKNEKISKNLEITKCFVDDP